MNSDFKIMVAKTSFFAVAKVVIFFERNRLELMIISRSLNSLCKFKKETKARQVPTLVFG